MAEAGIFLIIVGVTAEVSAVASAWRTQNAANNLAGGDTGEVSSVLKALIAKLPWMAVMGLTTIVLGMVLLMGRWPWESVAPP